MSTSLRMPTHPRARALDDVVEILGQGNEFLFLAGAKNLFLQLAQLLHFHTEVAQGCDEQATVNVHFVEPDFRRRP